MASSLERHYHSGDVADLAKLLAGADATANRRISYTKAMLSRIPHTLTYHQVSTILMKSMASQ